MLTEELLVSIGGGTPEGTRLHFCPSVRRAKIKVATSF